MNARLLIEGLDFDYETLKFRLSAIPDDNDQNSYKLSIVKLIKDETFSSKVTFDMLKQMEGKFYIFKDMEDIVKTLESNCKAKSLKVVSVSLMFSSKDISRKVSLSTTFNFFALLFDSRVLTMSSMSLNI